LIKQSETTSAETFPKLSQIVGEKVGKPGQRWIEDAENYLKNGYPPYRKSNFLKGPNSLCIYYK
jgi:hypothetical protein